MSSLSQLLRSAAGGNFTTPAAFALQCILLLLVSLAGNYSLFTFSPLEETIKIAQGYSDYQIAVLQGPAFWGPTTIAAVPMGILMARFPQSRLITIFLILSAFGAVGTAVAPTFAWLVISRLIMGVSGCSVVMAGLSLTARLIKAEFLGRAYWLLGCAQTVGVSLAFAGGGKLAAIFGPSSGGWRYAALWLAAPLVIVAALTVLLREPVHREVGANRPRHVLSELKALWAHRGVMPTLIAAPIIVNFGVSAANTWSAPIFARTFRMHADQVGAIVGTVILLSGIAGAGFGGLASDYCQRAGGPRRVVSLMIALALLNVLAGCFGIMLTAATAAALLFLLYFLANAKSVSLSVATAAAIPAPLLAVCIGIQVTAYSIVLTVAPVAASTLASALGSDPKIGDALAILCGIASLGAALLYMFSRRFFASSIGEASTPA